MPELPSGTVTFLFTDIEGSTKLWEQFPDAMRKALARHDALLNEAIEKNNGHVFKTVGDAFCAAFSTASETLQSALTAQQALQAKSFAEIGSLRVRMALHTGVAEERDNDYFGPALNRVARLLSVGHGGQVLVSEAAQILVRQSLPEGATLKDLGAHRLKDLTAPEQVFQLIHPALPAEFAPLKSLDLLPTNLPIQLTSFIGREKEIEHVKSLLAKTRLLTLTGSGGCGKTRLALQVAADLVEAYADGVWLVELAALSDPALVPQAVASALGVREEPGRTLLQTITDYLMPKQMLLLLDNCEHLLEACAEQAQTLLKQCPHLTLLITSREGLRIAGEQVYRVPSLLTPDPGDLPNEEKELAAIVSEYEAPRLFVERASLQKLDFALTPQIASSVAYLCHRLDGIPLAIELAAARVNVLSVEEINVRLEHRFRLLRGGNRSALPRQQTLQATIDWSYELLNAKERLLLARLSVFVGGWRLDAAEAICSDKHIEAFEMLDLLASLVEKSLVITEEREGKSRYRLLETIREYSKQRLQERSELDQWQERHLQYFLQLSEEAEPKLSGAEQALWFEKLQEEHDNLRTALTWSQQDPASQEAGLRLVGAIGRFWDIRGYYSEGREHLNAALSQEDPSQRTPARAKALNLAGTLAWRQGDYAAARSLLEQSLAIRRELGDRQGIDIALNNLGEVARLQGDYAASRILLEESLALCRELGDKLGIAYSFLNLGNLAWSVGDYAMAYTRYEEGLTLFRELGDMRGIAGSLNNLGEVAQLQGDYATSRAFLEESLALCRELGNKQGIAHCLNNLGIVAERQGDYATARTLHEESLVIRRELGDKLGIAEALGNLGNTARAQGDYARAYALYEESLALFVKLGDKRNIAYSLEGMAALSAAQTQLERAVRLWAAANILREVINSSLSQNEQEELDRDVVVARASLGEPAFSAAWEQGRAMTIEQAIEYAMEEDGHA